MSFILDALRKSESERQREATPDPARAPLAPVRTGAPVWAWYAIGTLSLALIAVAVLFWLTDRDNSPSGASGSEAFAPGSVGSELTQTPPEIGRASNPTFETPALPDSSADPLPIRELARIDPGLPEFLLEFVSFNPQDPTAGSAWINGRRYEFGERLDAGPALVEIRQDSVVLAHGGRTYLLRSR